MKFRPVFKKAPRSGSGATKKCTFDKNRDENFEKESLLTPGVIFYIDVSFSSPPKRSLFKSLI